jgi:hypothetical protein
MRKWKKITVFAFFIFTITASLYFNIRNCVVRYAEDKIACGASISYFAIAVPSGSGILEVYFFIKNDPNWGYLVWHAKPWGKTDILK